MRLTRDQCEQENKPATKSGDYQDIGKKVNELLAYTYFYPATSQNDPIEYPWGENASQFRRRFLSSYASTALVYPQQSAEEGLLHEVEFLSPRTLDEGKQVYLIGYVFEKENCTLKWQDACRRLQMGGERGYGWGAVNCNPEKDIKKMMDTQLFNNGSINWREENEAIVIQLSPPQDEKVHILAHTVTQPNQFNDIQGEIEPLVGREWRSHNKDNQGNPVDRYAGQYVKKFGDLCWVPGSTVKQSNFTIGKFGIWCS